MPSYRPWFDDGMYWADVEERTWKMSSTVWAADARDRKGGHSGGDSKRYKLHHVSQLGFWGVGMIWLSKLKSSETPM
jgi:hypothetical protein